MPSPSADAISVLGLEKRYGDFEAVKGISFDVAAGETFGFLGPNGSGKSTTRIDPLSYIVDPMRRVEFAHIAVSPAARNAFSPGVHWGGWRLPVPFELLIVMAVTEACVAASVALFSRQD